jgi:hypothetical protein
MDEKGTKKVWFEVAYLFLVKHPKALKTVNGVASGGSGRRIYDWRRCRNG